MRDADGIQIEEMIVHILDARGRGLILSRASIPIDGEENQALRNYFTAHISDSLGTPAATAARFKHTGENTPFSLCLGLLNSSLSLVDASQELARLLYAILERDIRTTPADLAVCFYTTENYPGQRFLAILKIDPSEVFRHVVVTDDRGDPYYVTYQPDPNAFTREKLQKCAFVRDLDPRRRDDYDMILLDRQVRDRRRRDVARYFQEEFLDAEDALDDSKRTDRLYFGIVNGLNAITSELDPRERLQLNQQVEAAITATEINLDDWIDRLPVPEWARERLDQSIRQRLPDRAFSLDPNYGKKLVRKRYFEGNFGFKLQVDRDDYDQIFQEVEPVRGDDGEIEYHRIVLHVPGWKEVTPP